MHINNRIVYICKYRGIDCKDGMPNFVYDFAHNIKEFAARKNGAAFLVKFK